MEDDSIIEMQMKLAYMEDTVQTLNDVVTRQQDQIDRLTARVAELREQIKKADGRTNIAANDETPPHY